MTMRLHDHVARNIVALALGITHITFAILSEKHLLAYTVGSQYKLVEQIASDCVWTWVNLVIGCLIITGLLFGGCTWMRRALIASTTAFGTWSFAMLIWGVAPDKPVSLGLPVLGLLVTLGAQLTAWSFIEPDPHNLKHGGMKNA